MLMKVQMRVWCLCCLALWASGQTHANSKMTIDDLSEVTLPEQGVYEENLLTDDDMFTDELFVHDNIVVGQTKGLQLSIEHTLAVNPQRSYERTNHATDLRLISEAPIGLLGYAELELKAIQYWQGDSLKVSDNAFSLLDIEHLALQYSLADISINLGRYVMSWGEVEGSGVIDVINPVPNLTSGLTDLKPQWLLSGSYYMPSAQMSWFVGLDPSVTEIPNVALAHGVEKEWGAKYGHTGLGTDWAVYAGRMVPNSAVLNLATSTAFATPYQWIGYSWNKAMQDDLVKFDVAYKRGLEHNHGYTGLASSNRLDTAVGLELNHGDQKWDASITVQHWLNYQSSYLTPSLTPVASNQTDVTMSLGLSDSFNNDQYNWALTHIDTAQGALRAITGEITWQPTDQWQSSLSFITIAAQSTKAYASLDGTQRLFLKTKFSY